MFLIVGLGNPGEEYIGTRHNVGFEVVEKIAQKLGVVFRITRSKALIAEAYQGEKRILLAKPLTYVNLSGESVKIIADWFHLNGTQILVIHDDMDIPFGEVRFKRGGSSAGHKGVQSIIDALETDDFNRVRIGIGHPPNGKEAREFVLEPFNREEREELEFIIEKAVDLALESLGENDSSISPPSS